jgi:hypothetical protein
MENQTTKSGMSVGLVIGIVLIVAIVFGYGTYVMTSSKATKEKNDLNALITALQSQISKTASPTPTVSSATPSSTASEPFTYTKNDQLFSVSTTEYSISDKFLASTLKNQSTECGTNKTEQYYQNLLVKLDANDKAIEYRFISKVESQDPKQWIITVIPNKLGYTDVGSFKTDFNICNAGADLYPMQESSNYLLFESSCGTGLNDGSGNPIGCEEVRDAIEPTIKLK